jgi:methionyl-tRNA formyltransferase
MRVGILARHEIVLDALVPIVRAGHEIVLVGTCRAEGFYRAKEADYEGFARSARAAFFCTANLERPDARAMLAQARCDIGITMNWLTMIMPDVASFFRLGVFNVHPGALPRYRGNACPNWAILNGEQSVGVTIHQIDANLDSGPIALQSTRAIDDSTHVGEIYEWLGAEVPQLLLELLSRADRNSLQLTSQPSSGPGVLRCYPRRPEDSRIDWRRPACDVHRLVRASSRPFAGAYTTLEGRDTVIVWDAAVVAAPFQFLAVPGQVAFVEDGDPVITCGEGMLRLTRLEMPDGGLAHRDASAQITRTLRNRLL